MSTREALLAGIIENPDDDAVRLVFADWCEDNGEADRAEFIRTQIRLEDVPEWEPERFDLEERSQDLLSAHWDEWTVGLPEGARQAELTFRRGFVGEAVISAEQFLECGEELVAVAPLVRLTLAGLNARAEEFARSPALLGLREVVAELGPRDRPYLDTFFRDWRPQRLRHLGLRNPDDHRHLGLRFPNRNAVPYPADWPVPQGLESFALLGLDVTDGEVAAFLAEPGWGEARRLEIGCDWLGVQSVLAACRHHSVRELHLYVDQRSRRAAQAVASNDWKRLDSLTLWDVHSREDELRAMTAAPWFSRLRSLVLNHRPFDACAALSAAPAGLRQLSLQNIEGATQDGLLRLLDGELVGGLTSLRMADSGPVETLAVLATSPRLRGLTHLSFSLQFSGWGRVGIDLIRDVVESPPLAGLTRLDLVCAGLGAADAARFASLSGLSRLRALELKNCCLGETGMQAVARSPHLTGLRRLRISDRGGPCLRALLEAPWLTSLRELRLDCKGVSDDDLEALASSPAVSRLRVFHLRTWPITRKGTEALANSPYLGGLLDLNVGEGVGDDLYDPLRERFGGRFVGYF